jgi:hypothetical protein
MLYKAVDVSSKVVGRRYKSHTCCVADNGKENDSNEFLADMTSFCNSCNRVQKKFGCHGYQLHSNIALRPKDEDF